MPNFLRRSLLRLGRTNRYTDGSGRALESNVIPHDLFIPPMSNRAYPRERNHWTPLTSVVCSKSVEVVPSVSKNEKLVQQLPESSKALSKEATNEEIERVICSPHKGNVIISGGGVVGLATATLWGLKGWHTTVIERSPPLPGASSTPHSLTTSSGNLCRPRFPQSQETLSVDPSLWPPFVELQYALLTRRGADVLTEAGLPVSVLRNCGATVTGIIDHPGAYNSWLSRGLSEVHPFATKVLSLDLWLLRQLLEEHVTESMPNDNVCVFHQHEVEAVYPLKQELVVRTVDELIQKKEKCQSAQSSERCSECKEVMKVPSSKKLVTSLSISPMRWEKKYAKDAIRYDLLISAEGVNSKLRELVDVEGFSVDENFGVKWFLLRTTKPEPSTSKEDLRAAQLSPTHIHRWLHASSASSTIGQGMRSTCPVPLVLAFPRVENLGESEKKIPYHFFSVMAYMPKDILANISDDDFCRSYMPDVWQWETAQNGKKGSSYNPETDEEQEHPSFIKSFTNMVVSAPTVFCEELYNSVGLPNTVLIGDAAHFCNPFWMQQLPIALEDAAHLLQQVDSCSRHVYDAIKQYSNERGANGDALRELTDRCLYFQRKKHRNPVLRLRNAYHRYMYRCTPFRVNNWYEGSTNHVYSRSIEEMLNSRGYTSYSFAETQQSKHRMFYHFSRLYT